MQATGRLSNVTFKAVDLEDRQHTESIFILATLLSGDRCRRQGHLCLRCQWSCSTPCEPSQRRSCLVCPPSLLSDPAIGSGTGCLSPAR